MSTTSADISCDERIGDLPASLFARSVLRRRLRAVEKLLASAGRDAAPRSRHAHRLRVATRRAAGALRFFEEYGDQRTIAALRRRLRAVRRAGAEARRADVQLLALDALRDGADGAGVADGVAALTARLERLRCAAQGELRRAARRRNLRALRRLRGALLRSLRRRQQQRAGAGGERRSGEPPYTFAQLARDRLPGLVAGVPDCALSSEPAQLHELRLRIKALRYAFELCAGCFPPVVRDPLHEQLTDVQRRLGQINDAREMSDCIARLTAGRRAGAKAGPERRALRALAALCTARCDQLRAEFGDWWSAADSRGFLAQIRELAPAGGDEPGAETAACPVQPPPTGAPPLGRVAAIDVGTNSIRLVVAERDPLARFRVIDEVRETTRLGSGLYHSGRLAPESVERTLEKLAEMRAIAEGYRVERIRAVGTSALREARDSREFLDAARSRAGVEVEVIDADYEARLAYASVRSAFELDERRFASIDLGGGSTEIVVSDRGRVEAIHKLPLGALRLTEMFGAADGSGAYRFSDMRRHVEAVIARQIRRPPLGLELVVGSGGTFTSVAKMLIRRGTASGGDGRFPFALRGYEAGRADVQMLLDQLRAQTLAERRRVPGLSERRAEIIVGGLCIIERLMETLAVQRLWVHDGGIRDGLLTEMLDDLSTCAARDARAARAALAEVRAFAQRAGYDAAHSEHVTRLSLRIFDQLAAQLPEVGGAWARSAARDVLRAAATLHDVGLSLDLARHHKHSYDMILSAALPTLSRREVLLIAAIARGHRRGGPHARQPHFARLRADDQRLTRELAGILRIADGLDRRHRQEVLDVIVHCEPQAICFDVRAADVPTVALHHARRKAQVFAAALRTETAFAWTAAAPDPQPSAGPA